MTPIGILGSLITLSGAFWHSQERRKAAAAKTPKKREEDLEKTPLWKGEPKLVDFASESDGTPKRRSNSFGKIAA